MKSKLYKKYKTEVMPALQKDLGYKNIMQVPRIKKVVVNVGYGRNVRDNVYVEQVENTLKVITGQKPVHNKAKKSISNFKIRQGMNIGVSVTLRGARMYDFLDRLVSIVFPRVRDFRGLSSKCFDQQGNCTIGFKEHSAFPEIKGVSADKIHGLEVTINTTAKSREEGLALLMKLGFPFKKE